MVLANTVCSSKPNMLPSTTVTSNTAAYTSSMPAAMMPLMPSVRAQASLMTAITSSSALPASVCWMEPP